MRAEQKLYICIAVKTRTRYVNVVETFLHLPFYTIDERNKCAGELLTDERRELEIFSVRYYVPVLERKQMKIVLSTTRWVKNRFGWKPDFCSLRLTMQF